MIDYKSSRIIITPHKQFLDKDLLRNHSFSIPYELSKKYNHITFVVYLNGKEYTAIIDTGSYGSFVPMKDFTGNRFLMDENYENEVQFNYNIVEQTYTSIDSFMIGDVNWGSQNIRIHDGDFVIIGNDFLRYYRLLVDKNDNTLSFYINEDEKFTEFHYPKNGFEMRRVKPRHFEIGPVILDSDAYRLGLRPKMRVFQINDYDLTKGISDKELYEIKKLVIYADKIFILAGDETTKIEVEL